MGHSLFHSLIPGPVNPGNEKNSARYWVLLYRIFSTMEEISPGPARHCFPSILPLCQASCFRQVRNMARAVNFMGTGSLLTCCEMSQSEGGMCDAMQQTRPWVGIPAKVLCTRRQIHIQNDHQGSRSHLVFNT